MPRLYDGHTCGKCFYHNPTGFSETHKCRHKDSGHTTVAWNDTCACWSEMHGKDLCLWDWETGRLEYDKHEKD